MSRWAFIAWFLVVIWIKSIKAQPTEPPVKVSGVLTQTLPDPIFYSTYFPIIFKFKGPAMKETDLRLTITMPDSNTNSKCEGSEDFIYTTSTAAFYSAVSCPSAYTYYKIINQFANKTSYWSASAISYESSKPRQLPLIPCNKITSHFNILEQLNSSTLRNYYKSLTDCPLGEITELDVSNELKSYHTTRRVESNLLERYRSNYVQQIGSYPYVMGGIYTNAYSIYQTMVLMFHRSLTERWADAVQDCKSNRLSPAFVSAEKLRPMIDDILLKKLSPKRLKFGISDEEIELYFSLPLTNCVYSKEEDTYVVRTLVPVLPVDADFKLIEIKAIPFTIKFNSSLESNDICMVDGVDGVYMFDKESGRMAKSDCKAKDLCFIPDLSGWPVVDPCIEAILENSTERIMRKCRVKCIPVSTRKFPFFRQLSPEKYSVAGHSPSQKSIFLNCDGKPYEILKPMETGALEVGLPCNCKIVYQSQELHSYNPYCQGQKLETRVLVPFIPILKSVAGNVDLNMELDDNYQPIGSTENPEETLLQNKSSKITELQVKEIFQREHRILEQELNLTIAGSQAEIYGLRSEIQEQKLEINGLKSEITGLKSELEGFVGNMRKEMAQSLDNERSKAERFETFLHKSGQDIERQWNFSTWLAVIITILAFAGVSFVSCTVAKKCQAAPKREHQELTFSKRLIESFALNQMEGRGRVEDNRGPFLLDN